MKTKLAGSNSFQHHHQLFISAPIPHHKQTPVLKTNKWAPSSNNLSVPGHHCHYHVSSRSVLEPDPAGHLKEQLTQTMGWPLGHTKMFPSPAAFLQSLYSIHTNHVGWDFYTTWSETCATRLGYFLCYSIWCCPKTLQKWERNFHQPSLLQGRGMPRSPRGSFCWGKGSVHSNRESSKQSSN